MMPRNALAMLRRISGRGFNALTIDEFRTMHALLPELLAMVEPEGARTMADALVEAYRRERGPGRLWSKE